MASIKSKSNLGLHSATMGKKTIQSFYREKIYNSSQLRSTLIEKIFQRFHYYLVKQVLYRNLMDGHEP